MDNKFYERLSDEKREELLIKAIINNNQSEIESLNFFIPLIKKLKNPKEAQHLVENNLVWDFIAKTINHHNKCATKALIIIKIACIAINRLYYYAGALSVQQNAHDIEQTKRLFKANYEGFKRFCHETLKLDADYLLSSLLFTFFDAGNIENIIKDLECNENEIEKTKKLFIEIWQNLTRTTYPSG